jgi:hypothetical protein
LSGTAALLGQDRVWVDARGMTHDLKAMDPKHRSNLIPFLRGNAERLQREAEDEYYASSLAAVGDPSDGVDMAQLQMEASFDAPAEDWLERTLLMRRLVELEQGIPLLTRKRWALENKAYEVTHGYKKVRVNK